MKTFASTHSRTQSNVKEHSPIYDLHAYEARQRKIKRQNLIKNFIETGIFFTLTLIVFSLLFWGV
ncbi:hypothetical protein CKN53_04265 [Acinetobacter baumannii]|uniref:hypothetical protein n=1 Tax=Acinetobacter baumannii TaxID=470 RepID=UPI000C07C33B|nr:hypothetical protein [Acinetobacter baumannii]MBC6785695.1 hypothetical protein [Acinetobacter baumannii]MBC6812797.1 hypothetical protein [Acinetobacter baumannii]MBC6825072.1 hypothetical protein [Acinetobacter baumannii]PHP83910.1 hypothetical protein CKN52_04920 [Acinetobacter baumannii]RLS20302.1 hypothetical protein CKN53_04265 [Acinetobacter baumannii]